ncbi:hypothetical protein EOD41_00100 [Mucilaginibacter limnophilus]|uniref:Uncharacterized protein n=1 Tax=Mucilaginibacter limnophilus TaxID=1932778 RepID=A0A437MXJ6_9SPHI|nr:hypothetical protein [Mucilaginibacter limnophilus]RVU02378.1 hypothetical protein EOD41_00100 [Mucilaginibacter limnophilus]
MERTPYFKRFGTKHQQLSINDILEYLRQFDDNLEPHKLFNTIDNVSNAFNKLSTHEIKFSRQVGQGLVYDGYLPTAKLVDGLKAVNRRAYFRLAGDFEVVDIHNPNGGSVVKSIQAPVLFTTGKEQQIYADVLNVGPFVNQFAYGFDLSNYNNPYLVATPKDFTSKIAVLEAMRDKVIYVFEQVTLEDEDYKRAFKYYPKHTVWFIFPDSLFLFLHSLNNLITSTELLVLCKNVS